MLHGAYHLVAIAYYDAWELDYQFPTVEIVPASLRQIYEGILFPFLSFYVRKEARNLILLDR